MELDLVKLRISQWYPLHPGNRGRLPGCRQFCKGDPLDEDFRSRIINLFINTGLFIR